MRKRKLLSVPEEILFQLLKSAFWGSDADNDIFSKAKIQDWRKVFKHASNHGVLAVSFDGILLLPKDCLPPMDMVINWGLNSQKIEEDYLNQTEALRKLTSIYEREGIKSLVLKGGGLSLDYPVPSHRECGDIDLYLFGEYEKGDKIVEEMSIPTYKGYYKHSKFLFNGVTVENHRHFLHVKYKSQASLEGLLLSNLSKGYLTKSLAGLSINIPDANFNALFLLQHTTTHFLVEGLALRHICDWAVFLNSHSQSIDFEEFFEIIKKHGLYKIYNAITSIAVDCIGLYPTKVPPIKTSRSTVSRILRDIFNQEDGIHKERLMALSSKKKTAEAMKLLKRRWKYDLVDKTLFYREMVYVIRD